METKITGTPLLVLRELERRATGREPVEAGRDELAEAVGISPESVKHALIVLSGKGIVSSERMRRENGTIAGARYLILRSQEA